MWVHGLVRMILRNRMGKSIIEVGVDDAETNSHPSGSNHPHLHLEP
jgi:hypothetical protein